MKRSEINQIMRNAEKFLASRQFVLPEWAAWSVDDWKAHQGQVDYITERMLGWDITDFGSGDFLHRGLFLSPYATENMAWTRNPTQRKS